MLRPHGRRSLDRRRLQGTKCRDVIAGLVLITGTFTVYRSRLLLAKQRDASVLDPSSRSQSPPPKSPPPQSPPPQSPPPQSPLPQPLKNLVVNPSFEQLDPVADGIAAGWSGSRNFYQRETTVTYGSAKAAMSFHSTDPQAYTFCRQQVKGFAGGKHLTGNVSAYIKAVGVSGEGTGATICVQWSGANGYIGGFFPAGIKGDKEWTRVGGSFEVPPTATSLQVMLYLRKGCIGTAYWDQLELTLKPSRAYFDQLEHQRHHECLSAFSAAEMKLGKYVSGENATDLYSQRCSKVRNSCHDQRGGRDLGMEFRPAKGHLPKLSPAILSRAIGPQTLRIVGDSHSQQFFDFLSTCLSMCEINDIPTGWLMDTDAARAWFKQVSSSHYCRFIFTPPNPPNPQRKATRPEHAL